MPDVKEIAVNRVSNMHDVLQIDARIETTNYATAILSAAEVLLLSRSNSEAKMFQAMIKSMIGATHDS